MLTKGSGPFGERPAGWSNVALPAYPRVLYVEPVERRVRVVLGGVTVADSSDVRLLHPPGRTPTYLFPRSDVRLDLLSPHARRRSDPGLGEGTYWTVAAGGRRAEAAAYAWLEPPREAAGVAGLVAFDWDSMDAVLEEDEQVHVHPRDPYTRVDVLRSSRHVRVSVAGHLLADSRRPRLLYESGLPVRHYLPVDDVRTDLLGPSTTQTRCPYKGTASYWSLHLPDRVEEDLVWSYADPLPEAAGVRGLLCFVPGRVDLDVGPAVDRGGR